MIALPIGLMVVGVVVMALVVVPLLLRERRTMRRAGMSNATPVCAACHYPLGGWSSPKCPECGQDVLTHRVRVRLATIRPIRYGLMVLAIVVGAPIVFAVCAFTIQERYRAQSVTVNGGPSSMPLTLRFEVEERWRTSAETPERTYRIEFTPAGVAAPPAVVTNDPTDPAFRTALDAALTTAFGPAATSDPGVVAETRAAIDAIIARATALPPRFESASYDAIVPAGTFTMNGGGFRSGGRMYVLSYLAWGAGVLVMLALCIPAARVVGDDGTRPVREQEWEHAGRKVNE